MISFPSNFQLVCGQDFLLPHEWNQLEFSKDQKRKGHRISLVLQESASDKQKSLHKHITYASCLNEAELQNEAVVKKITAYVVLTPLSRILTFLYHPLNHPCFLSEQEFCRSHSGKFCLSSTWEIILSVLLWNMEIKINMMTNNSLSNQA